MPPTKILQEPEALKTWINLHKSNPEKQSNSRATQAGLSTGAGKAPRSPAHWSRTRHGHRGNPRLGRRARGTLEAPAEASHFLLPRRIRSIEAPCRVRCECATTREGERTTSHGQPTTEATAPPQRSRPSPPHHETQPPAESGQTHLPEERLPPAAAASDRPQLRFASHPMARATSTLLARRSPTTASPHLTERRRKIPAPPRRSCRKSNSNSSPSLARLGVSDSRGRRRARTESSEMLPSRRVLNRSARWE